MNVEMTVSELRRRREAAWARHGEAQQAVYVAEREATAAYREWRQAEDDLFLAGNQEQQ